MHHAVAMSKVKRRSELPCPLHCFRGRNAFLARDTVAERLSLDVRHYIEKDAVCLTRIVHWHDVWMSQARGCLDLLEETLGPKRRSHFTVQDFDGDAPAVSWVVRAVHRSHSATPNLCFQRVAVAECLLRCGIGQWNVVGEIVIFPFRGSNVNSAAAEVGQPRPTGHQIPLGAGSGQAT